MTTLVRFRILKLSPGLQKEFGLPGLICADPEGLPFVEGQGFYGWLIEDNGCEPTTATNYLSAVLPFLTFLWEASPSLRYTASTEQIRQGIREYLKEKLGCVVRPHRNGNFLVRASTITPASARLFLTALRRFYLCAQLKHWYLDANPMEWSSRLTTGREFTPRMPPKSGLTLPDSRRGRIPETYFCFVAEDWEPRIIDEPGLRQRLLPAFSRQRDGIIARILFDSGARISEVLGMAVGDWRKAGRNTKARAKNKGSQGERVKEIWWSDDTAQRLRVYLAQERRRCDPTRRDLDDLPDTAPLFVTDEGAPYTYKAFYFNWQAACARAGIKITPHQIRHWFVTMALHLIDGSEIDPAKRASYRQALIAYMGWHSPTTIQAYDHHLRQFAFAPIHAALVRLGEPPPPAASPPLVSEAGRSSPGLGISEDLKQLLRRAMESAE